MSDFKVEKLGLILEPTDNIFEQKAVLNPAVYQEGNSVHLFYRAVDELHGSTIGYARFNGPTKIVERWNKPFMKREYSYESKGVEDPRITKIGKTFYMTYVAHDDKNAIVCLAAGTNIFKLKKRGIISPLLTYGEVGELMHLQRLKDRYFLFEAYYEELAGKDMLVWEKDAFLFPRKIRGKYAMIHRVLPDIQLVYFKDFKQLKSKLFWRSYFSKLADHVVLENRYWFESRNIGGGAPVIEVPEGWLLIYHAVEELNKARVYHACVALLDKKDPTKTICRLDKPLFSPKETWETRGYVNNVVFPTGTAQFGKYLYIYYGAADSSVAVARVPLRQLVKTLLKIGFK